jgi:hypothetical protein
VERGSGGVSGSSSRRSAVSVVKLATVASRLTGRIVVNLAAIVSNLDTGVAIPKRITVSTSGHVGKLSGSNWLLGTSCMKEEGIASAAIMQMRADMGCYMSWPTLRHLRATKQQAKRLACLVQIAINLRRKVIVRYSTRGTATLSAAVDKTLRVSTLNRSRCSYPAFLLLQQAAYDSLVKLVFQEIE